MECSRKRIEVETDLSLNDNTMWLRYEAQPLRAGENVMI